MTKLIIILVCALVAEAAGVVCLGKGLKQVGPPLGFYPAELGRVFIAAATNKYVLLGVALEAAFFFTLLYLLTHRDVSLIWPLTALGFVITTLAAQLVLKEHVSAVRWAGVVLIVMGAALVSYSEHAKEKPPEKSDAITPAVIGE